MNIEVPKVFLPFLANDDYQEYLLIGGYGSGKSYTIALRLILMALKKKRRILVVRQVYETLRDSCYALFSEITDRLMLSSFCTFTKAPLGVFFANGSQIIFRGLDKPAKLKSIVDVSVCWIEEASEITYDAYKEIRGRLRSREIKNYVFLSCNPTDHDNWVYKHFFGKDQLNEEELYKEKILAFNHTYYHHSSALNNPFLPESYLETLRELAGYDQDLYQIAYLGHFGVFGNRVFQNLKEMPEEEINEKVKTIKSRDHFVGMDFGFEESYNAVIQCAVSRDEGTLYVYDEIYVNKITDDKMINLPEMKALKDRVIIADSAEPKTIAYYKQCGYLMRATRKFAGSRLAYTRKMMRFRAIYISTKCPNTWRELSTLAYKKNPNGGVYYDEFTTDPHTLSALWYALDRVEPVNLKSVRHSQEG